MGARRTKVESEKIKTWKLADIYDSGHLQSLCMPEPDKLATTRSKVVGLLYTSDGIALWALGSNAIFKCWKWQHSDINPKRKLWITAKGISMKNDTSNGNPEKAIASIAMSNNGTVMSASGSKASLFCLKTPRVLSTFNGPPPTCITIHPDYCRIVAFGMNDSTILVCNFLFRQAYVKLCGHQNMITGLAFPRARMELVSSSADGQICVWWGLSGELKRRSRYIQSSENWPGPLVGDTRVQFQSDSTDFLVVHKSQLAIYNLDLECLCLWSPRDTLPAPISSAVYSCDYLLVYAGFCDGAIGIFEAKSLSLRCRIAPYAYIPLSISLAVQVYPVVVSAHPSKPNQIALGMSDGAVHVLEPLDEDPNQGGEHHLLMSNDNGANP